jgi:hypothetical protein
LKAVLRIAFCLLVPLLTLHCTSLPGDAPSASQRSETALCRADNFTSFLARYSEDADFQKRNTASPLSKQVVENVLPEPRPVEKSIELSQVSFPVFPSSVRIKADSLQMQVTPDARGMKVRLSKPDTDYLIEYFFERRECWRLVRIQDKSL